MSSRNFYYLDPAEAKNTSLVYDGKPSFNTHIINFGYIPDVTVLKLGDIVLTTPISVKETPATKIIRTYQKAVYGLFDYHMWTHAAIYIDGAEVVEAVPNKVKITKLYDYVPNYYIAVLRYINFHHPDDENLYNQQQMKIALAACKGIGKPYEGFNMTQKFLQNWICDNLKIPRPLGKRDLICSQFCFESYELGAINFLSDLKVDGDVTPADFAASDHFRFIDVPWLRLEK